MWLYQTKRYAPDRAAIALPMACRDAMGDARTMAGYEAWRARRRATRSCSRASRRSGASR